MKNQVINIVFQSIKTHEGFVDKPYIDPLRKKNPEKYGIPKSVMNTIIKYFDKLVVTFGYGFTYITREEADAVLKIRLSNLYDDIKSKVIPHLEQHPVEIQAVFLEMGYQLGLGGLKSFKKTLKYLEMKKYDLVAEEMLDSYWAKVQTPERAKELSQIVKKYA